MIDAAAAAFMSPEDHRHGFIAFMAALHAEFYASLDRSGADPVAGAIGYEQGIVAQPGERAEMITRCVRT